MRIRPSSRNQYVVNVPKSTHVCRHSCWAPSLFARKRFDRSANAPESRLSTKSSGDSRNENSGRLRIIALSQASSGPGELSRIAANVAHGGLSSPRDAGRSKGRASSLQRSSATRRCLALVARCHRGGSEKRVGWRADGALDRSRSVDSFTEPHRFFTPFRRKECQSIDCSALSRGSKKWIAVRSFGVMISRAPPVP